jgi:creatinine amidohydrolase/Fe(II)-dependent formamide hydrolase-like protein
MMSRLIGELTFKEVSRLRESSILCLPLGSMEQHGPHLPLDTDAVLAEALTRAIVARWGESFDLWQLPVLPIGLSREHVWAPGTLSLSVQTMTVLLRDLCSELVRSLPARNLIIVNGHGGNRGILEALLRELHGDFGLNVCALHTGALMSPLSQSEMPEIHGGKDETSLMLALAPHRVRTDQIAALKAPLLVEAVRSEILDLAVSWPWSSGDPKLADQGVIGDAKAASAEIGKAILERVVEAAGVVLRNLRERSKAPSN